MTEPRCVPSTPWLELLERSGLLVAMLDREGRILFASQSLCAACGCADEGLQGRDWLTACLPADEKVERAQARAWLDGNAGEEELQLESPGRDRDGGRLVCWRACVVREGAFVLAMLGVDITGRPANDVQFHRLADGATGRAWPTLRCDLQDRSRVRPCGDGMDRPREG